MDDPFKPLSLSIKELFGNADSLYKIPQYQMPYKWENEQVDKLWDDINEAYENGDENYFLGSIITAKPRGDEKSIYVDVVDGQQRLTTLMILFCVVRGVYPDINEKNSEDNPLGDDVIGLEVFVRVVEKGAFVVPLDLRGVDSAYGEVHLGQPPSGLVAFLPIDGDVVDAALVSISSFCTGD